MFKHIFGLFYLTPFFANAGFSTTPEATSQSYEDGKKTEQELCSGILYADSYDGKKCLNYASAVAINLKGKSKTNTVLSCTHFLSKAKLEDPRCKIFFKNYLGQIHSIIKTDSVIDYNYRQINYTAVKNDLAIYTLSSLTPCNPDLRVAESYPLKNTDMFTVSYGWSVPLYDLAGTSLDQSPMLQKGRFGEHWTGILYARYEPSHALRISCKYTGYQQWFYADSSTENCQTFLHDSGSIWFTKNTTDRVIDLHALTSHSISVDQRDYVVETPPQDQTTKHWISTPYDFELHAINTDAIYENYLTPLSPHRKWINSILNASSSE